MAGEDPMFTDVDEARYITGEDLQVLGWEMLRMHDQLKDLRLEMEAERIRLAFLYDTKPFDPATEEMKPHTLAKVVKAPLLWESLSGYHAAVVVRRDTWTPLDQRAHCAVMFHELLHIWVDAPGRIKLRPHDMEEFAHVVGSYGSYLPSRKEFWKYWSAWQRSQDVVSSGE